MSGRTLFGVGAIGEVVREIQRELIAGGWSARADAVYGEETCTGVREFQLRNSLPVSGTVEEGTWQALMRRPAPPAGERCLHLTAAFEGHGFELAVGDFDGAMLTWGIVGFTMKAGEVQKIVHAIHDRRPDVIEQAFGNHRDELQRVMGATPDFQKQWAAAHTLKNGGLAEPWRTMFASFGAQPEVQEEQIREARQNYLEPAMRTAKKLGFTSELGLALCFDIHVQNGGIGAGTLKTIQAQLHGRMSELERRRLVANVVADTAGSWKDDVRVRKLTVATGEGTVHGHRYVLANWGLRGDFAANELEDKPVIEVSKMAKAGVGPY